MVMCEWRRVDYLGTLVELGFTSGEPQAGSQLPFQRVSTAVCVVLEKCKNYEPVHWASFVWIYVTLQVIN
ncbi:hypothetical protein VTJ04DRAFT_1603 [Mycothermus thermophilus]|uniref:uncharacterized protein n=1 Tax=Humicola insolens TaxID=85995 RepID=UPI003741F4B9